MKPARTRTRGRWRVTTLPLGGGTVWRTRSRAGMAIAVAPLPGVVRSHAHLGARFGSLDTRLPDGTTLPAGTAHLLEHQMFQDEDGGDLFDVYAARGADANAWTSGTATTYLVACRDRFAENLSTLIGCVATFGGSAASVARERTIIDREIALYDDEVATRVHLAALRSLYRRHPVREDPAGTRASIRRIGVGLLRHVHEVAYAPRNLVLAIAGDVDPDEVLAIADERLPRRAPGRFRRAARPERGPVAPPRRPIPLAVSRPSAVVAARLAAPGAGRPLARARAEFELLADLLFGDGGLVQAPLFEQGIIDETFTATFEAEVDHAHLVVGGDVDDPRAFRAAFRSAFDAVPARLDAAVVERARRRRLGARARAIGMPEPTAGALLASLIDDLTPEVDVDATLGATPVRLARRLAALRAAPWTSAAVVPPHRRAARVASPRRHA